FFTTFLGAAFFGAGFFGAAAFFGAGFGAGAAGFVFNFGAGETPSAMSLKPFNAVIFATVFALIWIVSPVAGLRPWRAGRLILANFAKPEMFTISPLATVARITSIVPSTVNVLLLG
ncbi:MAG: hypothetical protein RLZ02_1210, partial [Actinomycetota bacterium]